MEFKESMQKIHACVCVLLKYCYLSFVILVLLSGRGGCSKLYISILFETFPAKYMTSVVILQKNYSNQNKSSFLKPCFVSMLYYSSGT